MSELSPADATLNALSGTVDPETALAFPAIGESPYYTSFYRLIEQINRLLAPINALRVYKDGAMTFGVRGGTLSDGDSLVEYAGAQSQVLSDDAVNSVYLTVNAGVATLGVSSSGWPTPSTTPHWPLAIIRTGSESAAGLSGSYEHVDLLDCRAIYLSNSPRS
ncbi:MAG: hypothetical protein ACLFUJ_03005 [Phycisphaerae bacterium]